MLRGLELMLMDSVAEKDYTDRLLRFTAEVSRIVGDIFCKEGDPDFSIITGAFDNPEILPIEDIRRLCLLGVDEQLALIKGYDIPSVYHPHGKFTKEPGCGLLNDYLRMDIDCLYYGESNDHRQMSQIAKDKSS